MHETDLAIRMKENYEMRDRSYLTRRTPVIIRIDGKAFHTFTRGFVKPYDLVLSDTMQKTMKYLCENIQGCVLGYTQSDEISLLLVDYKKLESCAWFDYQVQKMCSISSSLATLAFNKYFDEAIMKISPIVNAHFDIDDPKFEDDAKFIKYYGFEEMYRNNYEEFDKICERYWIASKKGALFDSRCFNIPKEEVNNYFYWREDDASKNSVQMAGRANFSHNRLQNLKTNQIQELLFQEKGINWNDYPIYLKRGSCCKKELQRREYIDPETNEATNKIIDRHVWVVDTEIPKFNIDPFYINSLLLPEEE